MPYKTILKSCSKLALFGNHIGITVLVVGNLYFKSPKLQSLQCWQFGYAKEKPCAFNER